MSTDEKLEEEKMPGKKKESIYIEATLDARGLLARQRRETFVRASIAGRRGPNEKKKPLVPGYIEAFARKKNKTNNYGLLRCLQIGPLCLHRV